jgi:hypothetical protein
MHTIKKLIMLPVILACCIPAVFGQGFEAFNTASSTTNDGWSGVGNMANGNNFGWSGTHFCNPTNASAAGEGGGLVSYNGPECYFGVFAGGVMSFTNVFHAQGQLALTNATPPDNFFAGIGYFLAADAGGYTVTNFIGMSIQEPGGSAPNQNAYRVKATILLADGVNRSSAAFYLTPGNTNYTWSLDFDPTLNRLLVEVYNNSALVGTATYTPSTSDLGTNISVDSFGIISGGSGNDPFDSNATAGLFIDNVQYTLTNSSSCIQVSPTATSAAVGTSAQTVTLTIPAALSADEYVTITSVNPSIATPLGGTNGSLTLDFPAGSTTQTFNVTGISIGSTSFTISDTNNICVDSALAVTITPAPLPTVTNCEYFTTSNSAAADGWLENNSRSAVDNYGWDNSSYCGDAPGEAGGNFGNPASQSSYAVTFPSPLSFNDDLSASGLFILTVPANNMDVRIGHFSAGTPLGSPSGASYVGLQVNEQSAGNQGRLYALIVCPDGSITRSSQPVPVYLGQVYPWSYTYDPNAGVLTANFTVGGNPVSVTATLSATQRAETAALNAFGLVNAQLSSPATADPGTLYIDDVCYTESLPCIYASPATITTTVGINTNVFSVYVPAAANAFHSFSVTVMSLNTNIAVPVGGVNGSLTLVFPAGNTNAQTFTVSNLSAGTATFALENSSNVCVSGGIGIFVEPASYMKFEPFNTAFSAQADGWVGYNLGVTETNTPTLYETYPNGSLFTVNWGWSSNNYCGDGAGEAGGVFDNPAVGTYYGDVFGPSTLNTSNNVIMANGQYELQTQSSNMNVFIGHFLSASLGPNSNLVQLGIGIAEGDGHNNGRFYAYVNYGTGASTRAPNNSISLDAPILGIVYNWGYVFNPAVGTHGTLTLSVTNASTLSVSNTSIALAATGYPLRFDSFGIAEPAFPFSPNVNNNEVTADPGEFYIDNVSYTIPTPLVKFTTITQSGGTTQLTFLTPLPGVTPVLQQTPTFTPPNWTTVSGVTFTNVGTYTVQATFRSPSPTEFYRVIFP